MDDEVNEEAEDSKANKDDEDNKDDNDDEDDMEDKKEEILFCKNAKNEQIYQPAKFGEARPMGTS